MINPPLSHRRRFRLIASAALSLVGLISVNAQSTPAAGETEGPVTELEKFIVTESASVKEGDVLPTSRPFYSVYGSQDILDVPRSVTALTPELMEQLDITDFGDLGKIGAGTQQINFYGVPGTPAVRGAKGGVFFDGIQRAFQRNEMPLSFGSLDAMDIVKGPAPAQFGAAQVGGYVNLIPKSPYFDKTRGSIQTEIGSYDSYRIQGDIGGPALIAGRPAAYRISFTGQLADSYYDRIGNDFVSLYGSMKMRLSPTTSIFTGGEFFQFKSNENAGWNRPTQRLIDTGQYVIGEPLSIVSSSWGGVASRNLIYNSTALVVPTSVVNAGVTSGFITAAQRDALLDLSSTAERAQAYSAFSTAQLADLAPSTTGFQYTPAYFAAGGQAFTTKIEGSTVLSDEKDYADSTNLLYFLDLEHEAGADTLFKGQFLVDHIDTDKLSTYGYAISTNQTVFELKGSGQQALPKLANMHLTYGVSARYTDAKMLQDFFDEPFSRRDISLPAISANSVILTGPQRDPNGVNFWSPTAQGGANAHSRLWQLSTFAYAANDLHEKLSTYTSLLVAHAPYRTSYPDEVDRVPAGDARRIKVSDHRNYYSASFSPVIKVTPGVNLYGTIQYGTALDPLQGGAIVGTGNFARNKLREAGVKTSLLDSKLFTSLAAFKWEQSQYDERSTNAELLEGKGVEFEATWAPSEALSFIAAAGRQQVTRAGALGFRTIPLTEEQIALNGGVLNNPFSGIAPAPGFGPYGRPATNADLEYAGTPEKQFKLFAIVQLGGGFGVSGGPVYSAAYWHNFDHSIRIPSSTVWNGSLFYRGEKFDAAVSVENITDEDYFYGADPVFAANTLITKAPGTNGKVSVTFRF